MSQIKSTIKGVLVWVLPTIILFFLAYAIVVSLPTYLRILTEGLFYGIVGFVRNAGTDPIMRVEATIVALALAGVMAAVKEKWPLCYAAGELASGFVAVWASFTVLADDDWKCASTMLVGAYVLSKALHTFGVRFWPKPPSFETLGATDEDKRVR
jgi:hypothetical protein